jgi:hypothetical protein
MDISPGLLQLACFRLYRHQGASSEVVVVGSVVRYATHGIRNHHRKPFATMGECHAVRHPHTRSRIGRSRLARTKRVSVASRSHTTGDQSHFRDVYGKKMGVATLPMDSLDAALRVHQLDSVHLHRVESETGKVASLGTALLCRVRGDGGDKLGESANGRYHRPDDSGWHSLCGSRLCGSQ